MSNIPLTFKIYQQGQLVRTETLKQEVIKVGKLSSAHLRLDDDTVSRMHAYIQVKGPNEIYISDLGSAKGTVVNGQKVNKSRLSNGDEVVLGNTRVVVEVGQAVQPAVPTPGAQPGAVPGMGGAVPGMGGGAVPGMGRGAVPGMGGGAVPGMGGGAVPGMGGGAIPGMAPAPAQREPAFQPIELSEADIDAVEAPTGQAVQVKGVYMGEPRKVAHFVNPRGGKPKALTIGLLGLGTLLFLLGVGLFVAEVWHINQQKKHQAQVAEFLKKKGLSEKFVPKVRGNLGMELGAVAAALGGMSLFLVGFARVQQEKVSPHFTIGSDPRCTYHMPESLLPKGVYRFPLVRSDGTGYQLLFTDKMEGEVEWADERKASLKELVENSEATAAGDYPETYAMNVPQDGSCHVSLGKNDFYVSTVKPGRMIAAKPQKEWTAYAYYSLSFVGHALLMFLLFAMPSEAASMQSDSLEASNRFAKLSRNKLRDEQKELEAKQKEEKKPRKVTKTKEKTDAKGEGPVDKRIDSKGSGPPNPLKSSQRVSQARGAGMLGVLGRMSGKALASVFGRESAVSSEAENALGALTGHTVGDAYGLGGLGLGGGGRGGGGSGAGGIGLGSWGAGFGGGGGGGGGFGAGGRGGYGLGRHSARKVKVFAGTARVQGSLDKNIIRRVIRRHLAEVKFCYVSKGLASNQKLAGQVKVQFIIQTNGRVSSVAIASSSLNHSGTEACIRRAIRRWRFPKPEGGIVVVRYPFNFKPGAV
jgi:TonB family protein